MSEMRELVGLRVVPPGESEPWEVLSYDGENTFGTPMFTVGLCHPDQSGQYRATRQYAHGSLFPPAPDAVDVFAYPSLRESDYREAGEPVQVPFGERWMDESLEARKAAYHAGDTATVSQAGAGAGVPAGDEGDGRAGDSVPVVGVPADGPAVESGEVEDAGSPLSPDSGATSTAGNETPTEDDNG